MDIFLSGTYQQTEKTHSKPLIFGCKQHIQAWAGLTEKIIGRDLPEFFLDAIPGWVIWYHILKTYQNTVFHFYLFLPAGCFFLCSSRVFLVFQDIWQKCLLSHEQGNVPSVLPHSEANWPWVLLPNLWESKSIGPAWLVPLPASESWWRSFRINSRGWHGSKPAGSRTSSNSKPGASLETCLLLISQRAAPASLSVAVIDFALQDFMALLEIIKRTTIKFFLTKSIAFLSPSTQKKSAVSPSEQAPEAFVPEVQGRQAVWFWRGVCASWSHMDLSLVPLDLCPIFCLKRFSFPLSKQKSLKLAGFLKSEKRR